MSVDREVALKSLSASSAHDRGQAARVLGEVGSPADLPALRRSLRDESVSYVQYALQDTIKRLSTKIVPLLAGDEEQDSHTVPTEVRQQIYGQAVEWVTGFLLHEIASPIGLAQASAKRELGKAWEASGTHRHFETIHRVFEAIEKLKNAAGVPRPQEFDLATMLQNMVEAEVPTARAWISPIGPKPFILKGDPALIQMVICNGIRNAVEAVLAKGGDPIEHAVTVNWGATEVDYWVSVLDRGNGIAGPAESAFEIGRTTKQNHSGFGLAIARQAISTLTGVVTLSPAHGGGAVYVARWKR